MLLTKNRAILCYRVLFIGLYCITLGDFDKKCGISLSRCHARVGDIVRTAAGDVRKASCTNFSTDIVYTKQQFTTHTIGKGRNALEPAFTTLLKSTVERFLEIADDKMRRL